MSAGPVVTRPKTLVSMLEDLERAQRRVDLREIELLRAGEESASPGPMQLARTALTVAREERTRATDTLRQRLEALDRLADRSKR